MRAIEAVTTVDKNGRLLLEHLPFLAAARVRVIVLAPEEDAIEENDWLHALRGNPAFEFLEDSGEDIYSDSDGRPHHAT